jgi:hypothetical protein
MGIEIWWWLRCGETYGNGGGILGWMVGLVSYIFFKKKKKKKTSPGIDFLSLSFIIHG